MRPQDLTRAQALGISLSCRQYNVDVNVPAVGGWNALTPATARQ